MVGDGAAPAGLRGLSVALGNFDGLHAGHLAVIEEAAGLARDKGLKCGVVCFEPPPRRYFSPDAPGFRLMSARQRRAHLQSLGMDALFELAFDARMASLTDVEFIDEVLIKRLGVAAVTVGSDFCFGKGRRGTTLSLQSDGAARGLTVQVVAPILQGQEKASSSRIRESIADGDMAEAARQLGRFWAIEAIVEPGAQRGRTIGFPTANMRLGAYQAPRFGVYAVRVQIEGEAGTRWHEGVTNFGRTPTVGERDPLLEVNIFDFSADIYGKHLTVSFVAFLRPETRFEGLDALKAQIARDVVAAQVALKKAD
jgi:riboflavin kinase/FMN adenylyltransferase